MSGAWSPCLTLVMSDPLIGVLGEPPSHDRVALHIYVLAKMMYYSYCLSRSSTDALDLLRCHRYMNYFHQYLTEILKRILGKATSNNDAINDLLFQLPTCTLFPQR